MRWLVSIVAVVAACSRGGGEPARAGERVVSLMPSATEVVAALGATDLLVGVDDFSKFPPAVDQLPKVGSFVSPNLEAIVRLRPTVVIVDDVHGQVAAALHDRGIETIACAMHALPDVKAALRAVGARLHRDPAPVIAQIDAVLDQAAAHRPAKHPRVLAIIDREQAGLGNLVAAGPGSYLDELLAVVGGDNVMAPTGQRYPKISIEEVLRAQPEVILDLSFDAKPDAWSMVDVPAVHAGRVVALSDAYLQGPSPRVGLALQALARAISPLRSAP